MDFGARRKRPNLFIRSDGGTWCRNDVEREVAVQKIAPLASTVKKNGLWCREIVRLKLDTCSFEVQSNSGHHGNLPSLLAHAWVIRFMHLPLFLNFMNIDWWS